MQHAKRLRPLVKSGQVTESVRIWRRAQMKIGGRYKLAPGEIEVTSFREVDLDDITPELARRTGFASVIDLLKIAKHGQGERVFLVHFVYRHTS